jgi:hypothetical protein
LVRVVGQAAQEAWLRRSCAITRTYPGDDLSFSVSVFALATWGCIRLIAARAAHLLFAQTAVVDEFSDADPLAAKLS